MSASALLSVLARARSLAGSGGDLLHLPSPGPVPSAERGAAKWADGGVGRVANRPAPAGNRAASFLPVDTATLEIQADTSPVEYADLADSTRDG